ncbi:MarR family transcriptional regulator [Erwinia sp. S63]|mgnify:CR=1 FL=1|uniref:MarR family winged helix-turn-helix transcriptional regulator n=1 Tax=Erwiniaceae TaxID=1903409 RepID=UPI00190A891A|nr:MULTISPECIES: MarR family transcriptional regulator [Erwiniaceae]MBK0004757.1 MarR family transcriptional regulator [Erwinia sp. S38]MBK0093998.1 MarR family transcriptional regulator [Erwinia sp. S59]MBK0099692.1 MarR family transcriptional regulator [Erwinia sp. S63]MBK0127912.1 MarR family transcriptional regulator [Pantoea sp. S61]
MSQPNKMNDADYTLLADFRATLRTFMAFSETQARNVGLTPQQHQALLSIRGTAPGNATVGYVAERLMLKPHSASGLLSRLEEAGLVMRKSDPTDQRRTFLQLTEEAEQLLESLSLAHLEELSNLKPMLLSMINQFC